MERTKTLRIALWTTTIFMEAGALLFFFGSGWNGIAEVSGSKNGLFGTAFLTAAFLFAAGAVSKQPSRKFIGLLCVLLAAAGTYFMELLLSQSWSGMAVELLITEAAFSFVMAVLLYTQLRKTAVKRTPVYTS